jgi:putative Mg2+ transporter-C (MgtC) family protein
METVLTPLEIGLRLLAATAAGMLIGINRDLKGKPTGMRTLALVCLGASLATVATVYLADIQSDPNAASRVVQGVLQGVLTGIAFLGAGAIIRKDNDETPGLTTAANVFVVAAIGIACGLGAWWAALIGWALALVVLAGLGRVEKRLEEMGGKKTAGNSSKPLPPKPSLADPASPDHTKPQGG